MGIGRIVGGSLAALVVLAGSAAGLLYASDYGLEANVVKTDCKTASASGLFGGSGGTDTQSSSVTVQTKVFGIQYTDTGLSDQACRAVPAGAFVVYHVRSSRTLVYDTDGGKCIYDSGNTGDVCTS